MLSEKKVKGTGWRNDPAVLDLFSRYALEPSNGELIDQISDLSGGAIAPKTLGTYQTLGNKLNRLSPEQFGEVKRLWGVAINFTSAKAVDAKATDIWYEFQKQMII